jgi:lambda family phage portal protein
VGPRRQCEITEKWSFSTVQRLLVRIWATDGELLVRKLRGPHFGRYGYRLQLIDIDRLYEQKNQALPGGGAIHSSIEVDPIGKAVAYWVLKRRPSQWQYTGYTIADYDRISADEIQHVFAPEFAEQIRGVPMMYAALLNLVHLGAFEEAAVIAARVGAANMGFIQSPDGGKALADQAAAGPNKDGTDSLQGSNGDPQYSAEPGAFHLMPPGYSVQGWNPKYPDAAIEPFIRACLRGVAAGLGVAYHNLANDLENVNYSSARIGELDERDTWRGMQQFWCEHFNQPIYEDWLRMQIVMGTLPFDPSRMDKYREVYWQARRWAWVDPLKEVGAAIEAINARITSRTRVAAENGVDLEDIADEIQAEEEMFKDKGIELVAVDPQATGTIPNDQAAEAAAAEQKPAKKKRWRSA